MTTLKEGDHAPSFEGIDQNGNKIALSDYKGKKLILYFYPKNNTPGCTKEACNLRDNHATLQAANYNVLGVSPDGVKSHTNFIQKYDLPFSLLADTDKSIANAFEVYGEKQFMGKTFIGIHRTTFLIDEKGVITKVIRKVKTKEHATQILAGG